MRIWVLVFGLALGIAVFVVGLALMSASSDALQIFQPIVCPDGEVFISEGTIIDDNGNAENVSTAYCRLKDESAHEVASAILLLVCEASLAPVTLTGASVLLYTRLQRRAARRSNAPPVPRH